MAILADQPGPAFADRVPGANKVVIACVSGLSMTGAEMSMAAGVSGRHATGSVAFKLLLPLQKNYLTYLFSISRHNFALNAFIL